MKKALAFLMAAVMLMSMLTACGNKDGADDTRTDVQWFCQYPSG